MSKNEEGNEIRGTMTFACGARFVNCKDPRPYASHTDKDGRQRWCVYDSEPNVTSPKMSETEKDAPCLHGCPCRGKAKRKAWRGFPPDYDEKREFYDALSVMRWQRWVTCYGKWVPNGEEAAEGSP